MGVIRRRNLFNSTGVCTQNLFLWVIEPRTPTPGFFKRLAKAYWSDWHPGPDGEPAKYRGYPAPVSNPPYPFPVWPIGGTVWIGYPNATSYPLTTALYEGKHGEWLKNANVQIYGWVDVGANASTSHHGSYANAPASCYQVASSVTLDQATLYIERVPDTIQTEHFDWGVSVLRTCGVSTTVSRRPKAISASNC